MRNPYVSRSGRCMSSGPSVTVAAVLGMAVAMVFLLAAAPRAGAKITGLPQSGPGAVASPLAPPEVVPPATPLGGLGPVRGVSWTGVSDTTVSPPDPNGVIGPSSYIEIINTQIAIYSRTGALLAAAPLQTLTGHPQGDLADPTIIWD